MVMVVDIILQLAVVAGVLASLLHYQQQLQLHKL